MIYYEASIIAFLIIYFISVIVSLRPFKNVFRVLLLNGTVGLLSLTIINLISGYTGFYIPVNIVSVSLSSFLGPVGILLFAIINIIFL